MKKKSLNIDSVRPFLGSLPLWSSIRVSAPFSITYTRKVRHFEKFCSANEKKQTVYDHDLFTLLMGHVHCVVFTFEGSKEMQLGNVTIQAYDLGGHRAGIYITLIKTNQIKRTKKLQPNDGT